jgi:hypothetical protein
MRTLSLVLCALTLSAVSLGQSNYAAVSGTVKDAQALPVVHATVTLKALSTGATLSVSTDGSGLFYAPALLPDDYDISTSASGFAPVAQHLHLEVGQQLALDVALKVGAVREGVEVSSTPEILHTTDAAVGSAAILEAVGGAILRPNGVSKGDMWGRTPSSAQLALECRWAIGPPKPNETGCPTPRRFCQKWEFPSDGCSQWNNRYSNRPAAICESPARQCRESERGRKRVRFDGTISQ